MPEVKTAAELEATIKQRIGLPRDKQQPQPSNLMNAEPRNITPQPQQSDASEMSAFKKFVSICLLILAKSPLCLNHRLCSCMFFIFFSLFSIIIFWIFRRR
jgi:hypothetical protein